MALPAEADWSSEATKYGEANCSDDIIDLIGRHCCKQNKPSWEFRIIQEKPSEICRCCEEVMCKACGSLSNANLYDATTLNNYFAHDRPLICGDCVKKGYSARNSKFYKCSACFENYDAICRSRENPAPGKVKKLQILLTTKIGMPRVRPRRNGQGETLEMKTPNKQAQRMQMRRPSATQ